LNNPIGQAIGLMAGACILVTIGRKYNI